MKYLKNFLFVLIISLFLYPILFEKIEAKTLADLKNELKKVEARAEQAEKSKKLTEQEIENTKAKIKKLAEERNQLSIDIDNLNKDIAKKTEEIKQMNEEIKAIVNYYQLASSESMYLEYIFKASSFTDFIYRLAVSEQLSKYMTETIDKYNKLIEENNKKIKELAAKQVELDNNKKQYNDQLAKLGDNLAGFKDEAVTAKDEIKMLKDQVNLYENTYKCSLNEDLSSCLNKNGQSGYLPSAYGFYRPIQSGALNYEFGWTAKYGAWHDGVDFSIPHGTPVYSIANGTVVSIWRHYSCGGNMVFIGHVASNGQRYTSMYAHLADPILISEGQDVTSGTQIGYSGGVHSIEWWDSPSCSTGAHLHLQVAHNIYYRDYFSWSQFTSNSFNPRELINFPSTDVRFNGR